MLHAEQKAPIRAHPYSLYKVAAVDCRRLRPLTGDFQYEYCNARDDMRQSGTPHLERCVRTLTHTLSAGACDGSRKASSRAREPGNTWLSP